MAWLIIKRLVFLQAVEDYRRAENKQKIRADNDADDSGEKQEESLYGIFDRYRHPVA